MAPTVTWTTAQIAPVRSATMIEADGSLTLIVDEGLSDEQVQQVVAKFRLRKKAFPASGAA